MIACCATLSIFDEPNIHCNYNTKKRSLKKNTNEIFPIYLFKKAASASMENDKVTSNRTNRTQQKSMMTGTASAGGVPAVTKQQVVRNVIAFFIQFDIPTFMYPALLIL